jgi:hypothetical protein
MHHESRVPSPDQCNDPDKSARRNHRSENGEKPKSPSILQGIPYIHTRKGDATDDELLMKGGNQNWTNVRARKNQPLDQIKCGVR